VVIYTQRLKTTVSTKQIRLQLPAESFDCDVGPTDICWQTVPESWSGGSERTIAEVAEAAGQGGLQPTATCCLARINVRAHYC